MTRFSFFILNVLFGLLSAKAADSGELRGVVKDADTGEPVIGAIVRAKGAFASTNRGGCFVLALKEGADSVTFRSMGYETLALPVTADVSVVLLKQKPTVLNDVIVEAPDIYAKGDTLVFNVSRYASAKDNAIIDVIKRLPGIKVETDGTIKYQGKPINKFYIDGNDFLDGQYGLATNNISHKDVKSVEVMENHQPVKALEGIEFPEEAGINLKLKDDARSRWVGVVQGAAGVQPLLYDGSIYAMRIAKKLQNIVTLKADNTGWNPANEIREHDFNDMFSADYSQNLWMEYITADIVSPPLSEVRTRDNLSMLANSISAWKKQDTSMRLKFNYMGDRLDYNSGVVTNYFSQQIPVFVQNSTMRTKRHDLSAQLYSETNKRGYYLKDKLEFNAILNRANSSVAGSYDIDQAVRRKSISIANDLKLVKRNEKRLFSLVSRTTFEHHPERLLVMGAHDALQNIVTTDLRNTSESRFGKVSRFWKYYVTAGVDLDYHRMNSLLSGLGEFDNSGVHQAFLSNIYATPQIDYERNGWRASFRTPLKWRHYSVSCRHNYIDVSPRLYVRRQLSAKSEVSASFAYSLGSPQPYLNITVPVLSDYRNLFIAYNPDKYHQNVSATLSYRYRNVMKSFFANLSATYNYSRSSIMSNQIFEGDFIISTYAYRLSGNETWYFNGGISKGLGHSRMVAGIDASSSIGSATSLRDNEAIPYRQVTSAIKPYIRGSIVKWLSLNYEADYGISHYDINKETNIYHSLRQKLAMTYLPDDDLHFTLGAEHFLTRFPGGNTANLVLLDASAVWVASRKVRLAVTANNLLNKRSYEYVNYGVLSRSEHRFQIRRRSITASLQYRF